MNKNGKKTVLFIISVCFCGILVLGISIYAKKSYTAENGIDAVEGSLYIAPDGSGNASVWTLTEIEVSADGEFDGQGDGIGVDTVDGSVYIDPNDQSIEGSQLLEEIPLD